MKLLTVAIGAKGEGRGGYLPGFLLVQLHLLLQVIPVPPADFQLRLKEAELLQKRPDLPVLLSGLPRPYVVRLFLRRQEPLY